MTERTFKGAFRLFRVFGVSVYIHWTWFILAVVLAQMDRGYDSQVWRVLEVLAIFGIVLVHEFGHALACKSVGGKAEHIMLWPLGGLAYVDPPKRPGAVLWSIAAGPLVNVVLAPALFVLWQTSSAIGLTGDVGRFVQSMFWINMILLIFNMLPIYPLDGGQIMHSLLWFVIGWSKSLLVTAGFGLFCGVCAIVLALSQGDVWLVVMGGFVAWQSYRGFAAAQAMRRFERVYGEIDPDLPPMARRRNGPNYPGDTSHHGHTGQPGTPPPAPPTQGRYGASQPDWGGAPPTNPHSPNG